MSKAILTKNDIFREFSSHHTDTPEWFKIKTFKETTDEQLCEMFNLEKFDKGRFITK